MASVGHPHAMVFARFRPKKKQAPREKAVDDDEEEDYTRCVGADTRDCVNATFSLTARRPVAWWMMMAADRVHRIVRMHAFGVHCIPL